jgi:plastocyanin
MREGATVMTNARRGRLGAVLVATFSILLAVVSLVARLGTVAAQTSNAAAVQVVDFAFDPAALTVPVGTTVTWTNAGSRPHTVTADDGSFDSGRLDPGEQFSQTFDQPGTFTYHCNFHPDMQGSITVTAGDTGGLEIATAASQQPTAEAQPAATEQAAATEPAAAESAAPVAAAAAAGPVQNLTPAEPSRLAHIHAGTCDELGIVVYSLANLRTYRVESGGANGVGTIELITGTANVPLTKLFGEPFSVHVHESAQNKQRYIACSDVGSQPPAPWTANDGLVLAAQEQNDSGFSGFTTLRPSADGGTDVTIMLAASPQSTQAIAAEGTPTPSTTYKSPTFGYTIGYGPTWRESENSSTNGVDRFVLANGTSYITFTGESAFGGNPQACVDAFVAQLTADPNVSNLALAVDEQGNPLQGQTEATGAYAIYDHDYTFPDRVEPYTLFVGCIPLIPNQAVLAIVQNVPTKDYNDQVALREALLRGLTLNQ